MYSILVVDDEAPVRESFTYMIENLNDTFTLCGTAANGEEALTLVRTRRPDIVIMDIAMPGIDGLDTIQELQKTTPEILFILATAYERFDMAQRAIPLGVFAYMVKPITRRRFTDTLARAREHLEERETGMTHRLKAARAGTEVLAREERELVLLLTWKSLQPETWERYREVLHVPSDYGSVFLLRVLGQPGNQSAPPVYKRVAEQFERKYPVLSAEYLGVLVLFVPDSGDEPAVRDYFVRIVTSVERGDITCRVGLGSRRRYDELYLSYEEARHEVSDTDPGASSMVEQEQAGQDLRKRVQRAKVLDDVWARCVEYWDREFSRAPFPLAKSRLLVFVSLLIDDVTRRTGNRELPALIGDPALDVSAIVTREEWDVWSARIIRLIVERGNVAERDQERYPRALKRAVRYIDSHYEQPLHLSRLADDGGVSLSYLSRLFAEYLGMPFNDYLNTVRLDAAEELLAGNSLSVKEIAYTVGYQDPNYFSRIFKKYRGLSPTAYLERKVTDDK